MTFISQSPEHFETIPLPEPNLNEFFPTALLPPVLVCRPPPCLHSVDLFELISFFHLGSRTGSPARAQGLQPSEPFRTSAYVGPKCLFQNFILDLSWQPRLPGFSGIWLSPSAPEPGQGQLSIHHDCLAFHDPSHARILIPFHLPTVISDDTWCRSLCPWQVA